MSLAAVITGAAGGIGSALCRRMREAGYTTIGIDHQRPADADIEIRFDLRETDRLADVARDIAREHALKTVIHNAAVQPLGGAGRTPTDDWLDTLRVNVLAADALVAGTWDNLSQHDGSVVVIGSVHAHATTAGINAYATSKAALEGWVRSAALDLAPGVRVNAVAPGAIDTAKLREGFDRWGAETADARASVLRERTALRRIGDPADVAHAVAFLVGDGARFITGSTLVVDGGALARLSSE